MFGRLKMPPRAQIALLHDIVMSGISFIVSLYICLGENFLSIASLKLIEDTALFMVICAFSFLSVGLYRGFWRYASINEVTAIFWASVFAIPAFVCMLFFLNGLGYYPRLSFLANGFVLIAFLSGPRILYRLLKDSGRFKNENKSNKIPVLLIGVGDNAELFIREMARSKNAPYRVVGLLDNGAKHIGLQIRNVKVYGSIESFDEVIRRLSAHNNKPQHVIIADEKLRGSKLRLLVQKAEAYGFPISRLPKITDLQAGEEAARQIRPVAIEDLLGRPQNILDAQRLNHLINGKRILITGAGGSIGSELVRQICSYNPSHIVMLDHSEYLLYTIDLEIKEKYKELSKSSVLADVRNSKRLENVFFAEKPDIVFHAAALKHVPLVEEQPMEGILTNVMGTKNIADLCRKYQVQAMVMISTDKVVNPTNIMGTTKRLAESYCQSLDHEVQKTKDRTRYITVRFGNVLGSNGSVVPLFQKQMEAGGPITITHPDIIRFFMTIREAVELVLQGASIGLDSKADIGKIFVLDMGEPVKIVDLAHQMITLAGLQPNKDIKIVYTGLRPGEKLFEELFYGDETLHKTIIEGIMLASPRTPDYAILNKSINELNEKCLHHDLEKALAALKHLVPEYQGRIDEEINNFRKIN